MQAGATGLYLLVGVLVYFDLNPQWRQDKLNFDAVSADTWNQNIIMVKWKYKNGNTTNCVDY